MKLLIKNIKLQLAQLDKVELKQDLLNKLYLNESDLSERLNKGALTELEVVSFFFSELPAQEVNLLQQQLFEQIKLSLNDLRSVWLLIHQIIEQPQRLIELMKASSPLVLAALQRVGLSNNWHLLIDLFLTKNEDSSDSHRWELINFLRHFSWLDELKACRFEAQVLFSLCFQILAFVRTEKFDNRLQHLSVFCDEYPFALTPLALSQFITFFSGQLAEEGALVSNKEFIRLLDQLLKKLNRQEQKLLINHLNAYDLRGLTVHCIENLLLLELGEQQTYKDVLLVLCTQSVDLVAARKIIQRSLNQVEEHGVHDHVEKQCYPLEQIILSLCFKNEVTAMTIDKLLLRYRYFILTLNPDELIYFIIPAKEFSPYYKRLLSQLTVLQKQLTLNPDAEELLRQREQLLDWCIERASHALLAELIGRAKQQNNQTTLTAIFSYYYEHHLPLRADLREAALSHYYDIDKTAVLSTLEHWYKKYLQENKSFYNAQGSTPYLYNEGQCIGFVDEANTAWSLAELPCLLNTSPKEFNQSGIVTGKTGEIGYFKPTTRQRTLSAQLLALVPNNELAQSNTGLALLIHDVLSENTLALLYNHLELKTVKGQLKRSWLEPLVSRVIAEANYPIPLTTLSSFISHFREEEIFSLWTNIANKNNAFSFFHGLILHDKWRELVFSRHYWRQFVLFLKQQNPVAVLADYLINFHKKPWFLEGLSLFAYYAQEGEQPLLLADALAELVAKARQVQLSLNLLDAILFSLMSSPDAALVLLQEFAQDNQLVSVQQLRSVELDRVCSYFNKQQLLFLVRALNSTLSWHNAPLYRLVLIIFHTQQERLFDSAATKWSKEELGDFSLFLDRHLREKSSWDNQASLGFKLLGFLLFYCAAEGQTNLFFNKEGKLSRLTTYLVPPALLTRLVNDFVPRVSSAQSTHLKKTVVVNDEVQSISTSNTPVLGVYLLHYTGPAASLEQLLVQYFIAYLGKDALVHPLSAFLVDFAEYDVSALIFDSLQKAIINNPNRLDATRFVHMAHYYAHQQKLQCSNEMEAQVHLLRSWGQTGNYKLVNHGAKILLTHCQDESIKQRLIKAELESRLEAELHPLIEASSLYTNAIKWCKRFWHYGFKWTANRSQLLAFADETEDYAPPGCFATAMITSPNVPSKERLTEETTEARSFINLLSEIVRSAANKTDRELLGKTKQTLFAATTSSPSILLEVASKQPRAHV